MDKNSVISKLRSDNDNSLLAIENLSEVAQKLSLARNLEDVITVVKKAARKFSHSDGVSFVLRDNDECYYVDEEAISPLWKGSRFPMKSCVSGWVMISGQSALIKDIYLDPRVPIDAYKPTFVKSMLMVPIRKESPIGAIGNYWATKYSATEQEVAILEALGNLASVAIENVSLYAQLQNKIDMLENQNEELGKFAWVASHDLKEPLRTISTRMELLKRNYADKFDDKAREYVNLTTNSAKHLQMLVDDLFAHSSVESIAPFQQLNTQEIVDHVIKHFLFSIIHESGAKVTFHDLPWIWGNPSAITRLFQNIIGNAIKFSKPGVRPEIEISASRQQSQWLFEIKDNGIGIDPTYHQKIFEIFQRQHSKEEYPGSGIGLATCKKIVENHNGRLWVDSKPGEGSIFYFTLTPYNEGKKKPGE